MRRIRMAVLALVGLAVWPAFAQQVGSPAPEFTLETFDGRKISLSELKGKEVCIMTWASWCPYCKASLPGLHDYYVDAKKAGRPVEILAVAIRDKPEKAKQVFVDRGMPYPTGIEDASFEKLYPASRKTPTWVIIDKGGIVRYIGAGQSSRSEIEGMMRRAQ